MKPPRRPRRLATRLFTGAALLWALPLAAQAAIEANKGFFPENIRPGQTSTLMIELYNYGTDDALDTAFTDTLPTGVTVLASPAPDYFCSDSQGNDVPPTGQIIVSPNTQLSLSGGTLPAGDGVSPGSCVITATITSSTAGTVANVIPVGAVSSSNEGSNAQAAQATLKVDNYIQPTGSKTFAGASGLPKFLHGGGSTSFTITLGNPNLAPFTGVSLNDVLPTGLQVAAAGVTANSCGGSFIDASGNPLALGASAVRLLGGQVPAGVVAGAGVMPGSCQFTVAVQASAPLQAAVNTQTNLVPPANISTDQGVSLQAAIQDSLSLQTGAELLKSFSPSNMLADGLSPTRLTLRLRNRNLSAISGGQLQDNLPADMQVAASPNANLTCGAAALLVSSNRTVISFSNISVPASPNTNGGYAECQLALDVVLLPAAAGQTRTNTIAAGQFASGQPFYAASSASVIGTASITGSKAFAPSAVARGGLSVLTITLQNASNTPAAITDFTDSLLSMDGAGGFVIAPSPAASSNCTSSAANLQASPGSSQIRLTGGTIPGAGNCQISVPVLPTANAPLGLATNSVLTGAVQTTLGTAAGFSADLTVLEPADVSKQFSPATIGSGQTSRLTITLHHVNGAPAFTNLGLVDSLATMGAGFVVADVPNASSTCGGSFSPLAGQTLLQLSGGFLPAGDTRCQLKVTVRAPAGTGSASNTIAANALSNDQNLGNPQPASATLTRTAFANVTLNKSFTPISIRGGQASTLRVTISNDALGAVDLSEVALADNLPTGMIIFDTPNASFTGSGCSGGTVEASAGGTVLAVSGASIAAGSNCVLSAQVTGYRDGNLINTLPNSILSSQQGVTNVNNTPASATLSVQRTVNVSKAFSPSVIEEGGSAQLQITIINIQNVARTGSSSPPALVDSFPSGLSVAAGPISTTCSGGTVTNPSGGAVQVGDTAVALSGGSFPANSTCVLQVPVTGSSSALLTNTILAGSLVTLEGSSNTDAASAQLRVVQKPSITKQFSPATIGVGGSSTLLFTLSNPNPASLLAGGFSQASFTDVLSNMRIATPGAAGGSCVGASSNAFAANATSLNFSGLSIPAGGSCTVSVVVTSDTLGSLPNTVGGLSTGQTQTPGSGASASLLVLQRPSISKRFLPSFIRSGQTSVLEIRLDNPNPVTLDLASPAFTDLLPTSPGAMRVASTPALSNSCGGLLSNLSGAAVAAGDSGIQLSGGSVPANGFCTVQVAVTATTLGLYPNTTSLLFSQNAGSSASPAQASLTVGAGTTLAGYVYRDTNSNGSLDNSEDWAAGASVFVNLVQNGVVLNSVALAPGAGYYQFTDVSIGSYSIVVAASATATSAAAPASFRFVNPVGGSQLASVGNAPALLYNFGLINALRLQGKVFLDLGTANDALLQPGERGLAGVVLNLSNCAATRYASTITDGSGAYGFSTPLGLADGSPLCVEEVQPAAYISSGASVNSTLLRSGVAVATGGVSYTYFRTGNERIRFLFNSASSGYSELNFAEVPANSFTTDNLVTAVPGSVVFHGHSYLAATAGSVAFTLSATASPAVTGWSETLFTDANCDGQFTPGSDTPLSGTVTLAVGQTLCILNKEFVPASAPTNAQNVVRISARFSYANTATIPADTQVRSDTTRVGDADGAALKLVKAVDNPTASPGTVLTYMLSYRNDSAQPLNSIVVNDSTPSYTVYVGGSASCLAPLPASLTSCTVTTQPADGSTGAVKWLLGGSLQSGASGVVQYQVRVQ